MGRTASASARTVAGTGLLGRGAGPAPLLLASLAWLFAPTLHTLITTVWMADEQGHGPVILAVALWLIWSRRDALRAVAAAHRGREEMPWASHAAATASLGAAWCLMVVGRSQQVLTVEALAPWLAGVAIVLLLAGSRGLRLLAVPLVALLFVVPLPALFSQTLTLPLKIVVSHAAESLLHLAGYPVARSGVILAVDQYRLLVADACAGLASIFTLEAMGLLYMQLRGRVPAWRDTVLALLLVPIAMTANVVRVVVLVLVTFHFGDAAGRGFLHGSAGALLFAVAMLLMFGTDRLLASAAGLSRVWRMGRS